MPEDKFPSLLTLKEAMAILRVGRTKIYRLLRSGEIPAIKIGKKWKIKGSELEKYINDHKYIPSQVDRGKTHQERLEHILFLAKKGL